MKRNYAFEKQGEEKNAEGSFLLITSIPLPQPLHSNMN